MAVSVSYREAYRHHRRVKGKPRERLVLYSLRLLLHHGEGFVVRRISGRRQAETKEHIPDIAVFFKGREVAQVEVTGTEVPFYDMKVKGIFVLPSKARYAEKQGERYILVFFNDPEFPCGEWLLWIPGHKLVRAVAYADEWVGETVHGCIERYYIVPKRRFNGGRGGYGLVSLAHYIRYLAGLEFDPRADALVNFMPR